MNSVDGNSNSNDEDLLESAFGHIQGGNDANENGRHWEATYNYEHAQQELSQLSKQQQQSCGSGEANGDGEKEEAETAKIAALYRDQSEEYFNRARKALITAMLHEHEKDTASSRRLSLQQQQHPRQKEDEEVEAEGNKKDVSSSKGTGQQQKSQEEDSAPQSHQEEDEYFYCSLSDEELDKRLSVFARLFAKERQLAPAVGQEGGNATNNDDDVREQQSSLEDRLTHLNDNLPHGFKTSEQRMRDINRGLNRLGFSLYSAADESPNKFGMELPKSEEAQVADIMAQAKDEVALMGTTKTASTGGTTTTTTGNNEDSSKAKQTDDALLDDDSDLLDDDDSSSSSHTSEDDDDEEPLTPDQMNRIRDLAVDAQAQLAQLIALLAVDEGGDAEIEFEPGVGKRALTLARTYLAKANREWDNK